MPTPESDRRKLTFNLRATHDTRDLTWFDIATAAGLTPADLHAVMDGTRQLSSLELALIGDSLQVDPTWLLTGTGPVPAPGEIPGMQMTARARRPHATAMPLPAADEPVINMDAGELRQLRARVGLHEAVRNAAVARADTAEAQVAPESRIIGRAA